MSKLSAELTMAPWLSRHWQKLPNWFKKVVADTVKAAGDVLLSEAKRNLTPAGGLGLRPRSGRLLKALRLQTERDGGLISGASLLYPRVPGEILNKGGMIRPKKGKYLVFRVFRPGDTVEATGDWVSTKQVIIKPTGWADKAQRSARQALHPAFQKALRARGA